MFDKYYFIFNRGKTSLNLEDTLDKFIDIKRKNNEYDFILNFIEYPVHVNITERNDKERYFDIICFSSCKKLVEDADLWLSNKLKLIPLPVSKEDKRMIENKIRDYIKERYN